MPNWQEYKRDLRKPIAKKLSSCGKKARLDQVHTHTTGVVSFARRKHEFVIANEEISRKKLELVGGPEGNVEPALVAWQKLQGRFLKNFLEMKNHIVLGPV